LEKKGEASLFQKMQCTEWLTTLHKRGRLLRSNCESSADRHRDSERLTIMKSASYDHVPMGDKSEMETIRPVVWNRRFLAATVLVPPSVAEHLNMNAMAVLAVIRNEAEARGDAPSRWHESLSAPTSAGPKLELSLGSPKASA
jgi:hypothetical protein